MDFGLKILLLCLLRVIFVMGRFAQAPFIF